MTARLRGLSCNIDQPDSDCAACPIHRLLIGAETVHFQASLSFFFAVAAAVDAALREVTEELANTLAPRCLCVLLSGSWVLYLGLTAMQFQPVRTAQKLSIGFRAAYERAAPMCFESKPIAAGGHCKPDLGFTERVLHTALG